jgi:hypothetical protein
LPAPVIADGGPFLSDPDVWALLEESQQTAVVTLNGNNTVDVDLFASLLDSSGQSHEVMFFVPLGTDPSDFRVVEKTSRDFDEELTAALDEALREEAETKAEACLSFLVATAVINGGWLAGVCLPLLLSGCTGLAPEETYETESSRVEIYGLDEDTDLDALINTTGLDPSVRETLSRLRGQRIAVVRLQTQPPVAPSDGESDWPTGQPGIHLAWTTPMVAQSGGAVYSYPLGTGSAWSRPIGLVRVYVVAPPGADFTIQYPTSGTDYSGYLGFARTPFSLFNSLRPRITSHYDAPAYAVDETGGDFGHIWRATYTQSNFAEDIVISSGSPGGFMTTVRQSILGWGIIPPLLLGLLIAVLLWVTAWRYCMPRMLGTEYRWRDSKLWHDSLVYVGINTAVVLAGAAIAGGVALLGYSIGFLIGTPGFAAGLIVAMLVILAALFGVPSILVFTRRDGRKLGISGGRAAAAYVVVALVANFAYLAFALGYTALIGAI